jgi:streptogramin lyase
VWITEWFGSTTALRRFDPGTRELCAWAFPGGVSSYYALVSGGAVWTANWANDRLVRFDPATGAGRRWSLGAGSDPLGMALDADGNLWVADAEKRQLLRLAPGSGLLTRYALPTGTTPQVVALIDGLVWYTESASGTVGSVDPLVAAGSSAAATSDTFSASAACETLPAGAVTAAGAGSGALAWSSGAWDEIIASGGWHVYKLPAGASPFGIASVDGALWVVDRGRRMIARAGGPAATETPTATPTRASTPAGPPTATATRTTTPTVVPGPSPTASATPSATLSPTAGPSPTPSPTVSAGPDPASRTYLPFLSR